MVEFDVELQNNHTVKCWFVDDEGTALWMDRLHGYSEIRMGEIGKSRAGRTIYGLIVGHGPAYMSITAGAHADEPAGPMTACLLAEWLAGDSASAKKARSQVTFMICPQVNPDGAEANKEWFAPTPDFETYLRHVKREGPGDDIEFGYPNSSQTFLRPENKAVAEFLEAGFPYTFHASLHSMGFAQGAWLLLEKSVAAKKATLRSAATREFLKQGFKLHDINRLGEKGFNRIAPGLCTTPTSTAMRKHFEKLGDFKTADKFYLSSMEWIQADSPDALIMVTELPNFSIEGGYVQGRHLPLPMINGRGPAPGATAYEKFRNNLRTLMLKEDYASAVSLAKEFDLQPVPFSAHCKTQFELVLLSAKAAMLGFVEEE